MKYLITLLVAILTLNYSYSQNTDGISQQTFQQFGNLGPNAPIYILTSEKNKVEGTRLLNSEWEWGRILLRNGELFSEPFKIKLDLMDHKLYVNIDDEFTGEIPSDKVDALLVYNGLDSALYEVHNMNKALKDGPEGYKYYKVVYNGDYVLFHLDEKYLRKEKYIENLGLVRRPDVWKSLNTFWLVKNGRLVEVKRNKKSFQRAMPEYARKINTIVKKEKTKFTNEKDLVKLMQTIEG